MTIDRATHDYGHCLEALLQLFEAVGTNWADWIREDLRLWRAGSDTSHHLAAYGGMGSLNDLWLCPENQHRLTKEQETWANPLMDWLKSSCWALARNPDVALTEGDFSSSVDHLQGWHCNDCKHAEVVPGNIEWTLAESLLPQLVSKAYFERSLDKLVTAVLALDIPGTTARRREITHAAKASKIVIRKRDGWMVPCPKCKSEATAICRWRFVTADGVERLEFVD